MRSVLGECFHVVIVLFVFQVMEAMMIIMAIMMATDLGQVDLEETSITVFQERQITDMGPKDSLPASSGDPTARPPTSPSTDRVRNPLGTQRASF